MALTRTPEGWLLEQERPYSCYVTTAEPVLSPRTPGGHTATFPDVFGRGPDHDPAQRLLVIADHDAMTLHGHDVEAWLTAHGIAYDIETFVGGEHLKSLRVVERMADLFDRYHVPRDGLHVAGVGGGSVTDTLGVTTLLYRRGVDRLNVPTTLVGMIDAAIAAKVAVDHRWWWKNRLGGYHPAGFVVVDPSFLATLPPRRHSDGLGEILKLAIIADALLFDILETYGAAVLRERFQGRTPQTQGAATQIIDRAIDGMLLDLDATYFERPPADKATYLGHTVSPVVEMAALRRSRRRLRWRRGPALLHGEVVILDTLLFCGVARGRGLIDASAYDRIVTVTDALGLPTWDSLMGDEDLLAAGMADSTRHRGGLQRAPVPNPIGTAAYLNDVTPAELRRALLRQRNLGGRALG